MSDTKEAKCACLMVHYSTVDMGNGWKKGVWSCVLCGAEFVRKKKDKDKT